MISKLMPLLIFLSTTAAFAAPSSPIEIFKASAKYNLTMVNKRQKPRLQLSPADVTIARNGQQTTIKFDIKKEVGVQEPSGPISLVIKTADIKMNQAFNVATNPAAFASLYITLPINLSAVSPLLTVGAATCNNRECDFNVTSAFLPSATLKIYSSPGKGVYFMRFELADKSQTMEYRLSRARL